LNDYSNYYDAFVSIQRGLFNTRDRAQHTRKRKIVSHTFSARSIGQFEQYIRTNLQDLIRKWNELSDEATQHGKTWASIDSLHWFNYLAFDIIGDLAFGEPFGMVNAGADVAEVRATPTSPPTYAPAVQVLNRRGEVSNTLGALPSLKPYAKYLPDPFFSQGLQAVNDLAGIAIARVRSRLDQENSGIKSERVDLLARLMEGKDDEGRPMGQAELTAEALTQLIAGSDTTSNTSCAFFFWATKTPKVYERLRQELDSAVPEGGIPTYEQVKDLPYLNRTISETLRIHSTSSLGLPRQVPPGASINVLGRIFPPGSVLSVPAYTIHHDTAIWGPDALEFNPDRWESRNLTERQKNSFIPFSHGPRACVGRE
jgi:benzoate 4-monooxygenase